MAKEGGGMINEIVESYKKIDRDVDVLSGLLLFLMLLVIGRVVACVFQKDFDALWPLLTSAIPIVAAMLVVRVANRQITHGNLIREDDRRQQVVRVTHHLMAIALDMRQRVGYMHKILGDGSATPFLFEQLATSIESRYEVLLEPEAYRYLPGSCIDIIVNMSGSIFGLTTVSRGVSLVTEKNGGLAINAKVSKATPEVLAQLEHLNDGLTRLIDGVHDLRNSIEKASKSDQVNLTKH